MSLYRLLLIKLFAPSTLKIGGVLIEGIIMDLGALSFFAIPFIIATWINKLHPYKSRAGVIISIGYFLFVAFILALIYAIDLVSIKTFGQRLVGAKFFALFNGHPKAAIFKSNFPFIPFIIITVLIMWVWWWLIDWLHTYLGTLDRAERTRHRYIWQAIAIGLHVSLISISVGIILKYIPKNLTIGKFPASALSNNPVLSLLFQ
jgi:hypothetical protein